MSKQNYTINIATGKTSQSLKVSEEKFKMFMNLKIGSKIDGSLIEEKYIQQTFSIHGGSTKTGTPMYKAIVMPRYIKTRYKQNTSKGLQRKMRVYGNHITPEIVAVDLVLA
jgi:ribosomal protein S6E (S10)